MSLVRLKNVSKAYAGADVLACVDFRIEAGEHIGLIGRNGTGKSTIFRIITGEVAPDAGLVERMRKSRTATLAQLHKVAAHVTIFDMVMGAFKELLALEDDLKRLEEAMSAGDEAALDEYSDKQERFTARGGYHFRTQIKQVLHGLGFGTEDFKLPFEVLSGGQRTRLMLALTLLEDADLLLLDEPENHLDFEAREWLDDYLRDFPKAVVIISHDRQMLDAVAQTIVELERGVLHKFTGNYASYLEQKALLTEQQQAAYDRQKDHIRKEESWIKRFQYKATKAKQAQSRMKRLEKIERVESPKAEVRIARFSMGEVHRSGALVLEARGLGVSYDDLRLYKDVSFQVQRGERVGIIGPNGAGKTTLLRQIANKLGHGEGTITLGSKVKFGFYEQNHESMNPANDVLTEVHTARPAWKPEQIRTFLGSLLFTGDDAFKPVGSLSGGELSRVAMAKLILGDANLLLLDEPTNHLDIASREALEGALADYAGTLILVSHDRALIDRLVDKLVVIQNGACEVHLGNYSHYRWKQGTPAETKAANTDAVLKIRRDGPAKKDQKSHDRAQRQWRRKVEAVERDIEAKEAALQDRGARFAEVAPTDYVRLQELQAEHDALQAELRALYSTWETLSEEKSSE